MNKEEIKKEICDGVKTQAQNKSGESTFELNYKLNLDKLSAFLENIDFQLLTLQKVMKEKFGEIKEKFETGYTTPDSGHITETTYTQKPKEEVKYYRCKGKVPGYDYGLIYKADRLSSELSCFQEIKKPKKGDEYYKVSSFYVIQISWFGDNEDLYCWKSGNFYWTREEAQEVVNEINNRDI